MPDILNSDLVLAALVAVVAGLTKGFAGFGGGMIMTPPLALIYSPIEAIAITTLLEALASYQLLPRALPRTDWTLIGPLSLLCGLFTPIGVWALVAADPNLMRRVIGVLVLSFALITLSGWRYRGPKRPAITFGVGALAGLMMGGTGLGGPPVLLYVLSRTENADRTRAGIIMFFAITVTVLLLVLLWQDAISAAMVLRAAILAPVYWVVTWTGGRLYGAASDVLYHRVALSLLVLAGAAALIG